MFLLVLLVLLWAGLLGLAGRPDFSRFRNSLALTALRVERIVVATRLMLCAC